MSSFTPSFVFFFFFFNDTATTEIYTLSLHDALPIWLHLRRKQETNLHLFPTLRFLDDQPEPRRSPFRLRDILLFVLRALALLLLVAAFAWPYLRRADTVPIKESRVYILDNTLSRQAGSGFSRDRDRLLSEIAKAGLDTQVAVVELTSV